MAGAAAMAVAMPTAPGTPWPALGLMAASGFAGLGYQIVWAQQGALWLGHESAAVLAVVTAFFGGIALGALAFGRLVERLGEGASGAERAHVGSSGERHVASGAPLRWYAGCEALIGAWGLVLVFAMAPASGWLQDFIGPEPAPLRQWAVAFIGTFVLLLPATAAMGATLPAMERITAWLDAGAAPAGSSPAGNALVVTTRPRGGSIAALYAANTFGAVLGVLATAFWTIPAFGLAATAALCVALNLACAAVALRWPLKAAPRAKAQAAAAGRGAERLPEPFVEPGAERTVAPRLERTGSPPSWPPHRRPRPRGTPALLAATGLLGIGYEVLVVRVLSQVTEETVYTFAMLLAVYLVGTALGAAAYQRWLAGGHDDSGLGPPRLGQTSLGPQRLGRRSLGQALLGQALLGRQRLGQQRLDQRLLGAVAAACLVGAASLWAAERVKAAVGESAGMAAALGTEALLALGAFLLPTLAMGALFSHLAGRAQAQGVGFGRALGINTLGAAAAPLVFGVLLAPALGAKTTLLAIAAGYLLLSVVGVLSLRGAWPYRSARTASAVGSRETSTASVTSMTSPTPPTSTTSTISVKARALAPFAAMAVALAAMALWAPPLAFVDVPEGGRVVSYAEGPTAAVSVVEDAGGVARLRIDNRQQEGSSETRRVDGRQALLPLLLHPAPRRALFLGLGTGVTAGVAAEDPTLQVDAVELLPEVIDASDRFAPPEAQRASRLRLIAADARRYVRTTAQRYDVIVSDNFHPARSGSGALYTTEHFGAVRARLAAGGLFCQWLPLHQLDLATLHSIVRSFLVAWPDGTAILASNSLETPVIGLVGRAGPIPPATLTPPALERVRRRLEGARWPGGLGEFGIDDEFALLGSVVAGPASLARFAAGAPLNTDDRPVVAYRAPRITYAPDSLPRERLLALLAELSVAPAEVVSNADAPFTGRLTAYAAARDRFIAIGQSVRPSGDVRAMLAQVRGPLLEVLRTSPDFRPAYDPLLRMATVLARDDPAAGAALLAELARLQPARAEAQSALAMLGAGRAAR